VIGTYLAQPHSDVAVDELAVIDIETESLRFGIFSSVDQVAGKATKIVEK